MACKTIYWQTEEVRGFCMRRRKKVKGDEACTCTQQLELFPNYA